MRAARACPRGWTKRSSIRGRGTHRLRSHGSLPAVASREGAHNSLVSVQLGGEAVPHGSHKLSHGVVQGEDHSVGARIKRICHLEPRGQTGSDQLPVPAGHPLETRVGGRATKTRARGRCSPQRRGLREALARPAHGPGRPSPAPALVCPWCALKQCTRWMMRWDVSLR